MTPRRPTIPGGIPTAFPEPSHTPTPVMLPEPGPRPASSRALVTILSTILGVLVSTIAITGFVGKYFYVDRSEYSEKTLRDADERGRLQGLLGRVETTLTQQEKALDNLASAVRDLERRQVSGRR